MTLSWFYYSDTNASSGRIPTILNKKQQTLTEIYRLEDVHQALRNTSNAILFLKTNTVYNIYDLCQEVSANYPHVYIILLVPDNMENIKKAMLVGASNIIRQSNEEEELTEVITQAFKYMERRINKDNSSAFYLQKENSRVISVCSAKGGVGKSSITINLAVALTKQNLKVAIIDADLQFGDVAIYLNLKPKKTIYEWIKEAYENDPASIGNYITNHESGVSILAAPPRPEFFEIVCEDHISTAIQELKKAYDVVLIDSSAYLSEVMLKCLVDSQEIFLITTREIPALRNTKLLIDTLESLEQKDKVKVILNREQKSRIIETKRIEESLNCLIYATFPEQTNAAFTAVNQGIPFILQSPRLPLAKAVIAFAEQISVNLTSNEISKVKSLKRRHLVKK